jgi:ABC-type dipeptide/oligopeptide/nickel transport system permease component
VKATTVVRRLLLLVLVLLGVSMVVFSMMHLTPGDPVELMMSQAGHVTEEEIAALRKEYGLDLPFHRQYARFVGHAIRGDLGLSYKHRKPVAQVIATHLPATAELTLWSLGFALLFAIPVGVLCAVKRGSPWDWTAIGASLVGVSMPGFWLGLILLLIFAIGLKVLPVTGRIDHSLVFAPRTGLYVLDSVLSGDPAALWSALKHLILPAVTMGAPMAAITSRMVRTSMIEALQQDYVRFARAKGLPESVVVIKHALRNALIPTITVVALQTGLLLSGNMIIETVFSWPGVGRLAVQAIEARDYPLVQGVVLLYATTYVLLNLVADLLYSWVNPRIEE